MATPATLPSTPNAIPGVYLPDMFGPGISHSQGINLMIADLYQAWLKLGYGASVPSAGAGVLRATGAGTSAFGKVAAGDYAAGSIGNADVSSTAGIAYAKLALAASILASDLNLTRSIAKLSSDVAMTPANTYVAGPSLSLAAGVWLVMGTVTVLDTGALTGVTAKLWDSSTVLVSSEEVSQGALNPVSITLAGVVVPGSTTTYLISVAGTAAAGVIKATAPHNGAGATASYLQAIRIG